MIKHYHYSFSEARKCELDTLQVFELLYFLRFQQIDYERLKLSDGHGWKGQPNQSSKLASVKSDCR